MAVAQRDAPTDPQMHLPNITKERTARNTPQQTFSGGYARKVWNYKEPYHLPDSFTWLKSRTVGLNSIFPFYFFQDMSLYKPQKPVDIPFYKYFHKYTKIVNVSTALALRSTEPVHPLEKGLLWLSLTEHGPVWCEVAAGLWSCSFTSGSGSRERAHSKPRLYILRNPTPPANPLCLWKIPPRLKTSPLAGGPSVPKHEPQGQILPLILNEYFVMSS